MNLQNINVAIMNREGSPFPSGTKNQAIASVVAEKNASNVQDYNEILVFLVNRDVQDVSYLWWAHYEFITPVVSISQSNELIGFCLK